MPTIYVQGVQFDDKREFELHRNELGYTVGVKFNKDSPFKGAIHVYHNVTEVHYMYASFEASCAFESDIHGTGCTRFIKYIDEIEITRAVEIAESY